MARRRKNNSKPQMTGQPVAQSETAQVPIPELNQAPAPETAQVPGAAEALGHPAWTNWIWRMTGRLGGGVSFIMFALLVWPVAVVLATSGLLLVAVYWVTTVPGIIVEGLGVPMGTLLSSMDRMLFSWVFPVLFLTLVSALLSYRLTVFLCGKLYAYTLRVRQGLYAGRGGTLATDLADRRAERARAREEKAAKKAEMAGIREDAQAAEESLAAGGTPAAEIVTETPVGSTS